jgi:hypothetical protein
VEPDRGQADPRVTETLGAYHRGELSEYQLLGVLREARVLVPIVAVAADGESEKQTEMAVPKLVGKDGREAMMAYTSLDTLRRWEPGARPVPMPMARACEAAVAENCALVLDVAGPVQVDLEGQRLAAMASGEPVPLPDQDPEIIETVRRVAPGATLDVAEHGGLIVEIAATTYEEASRVAQQIVNALQHRLRRVDVRIR